MENVRRLGPEGRASADLPKKRPAGGAADRNPRGGTKSRQGFGEKGEKRRTVKNSLTPEKI